MTSDSDLDEFFAKQVGVFYGHDFDYSFGVVNLSGGLSIYKRSNDLQISTTQVSIGVTF